MGRFGGLHQVREGTRSGEPVVTTGSPARLRTVHNGLTIHDHGAAKRSTVFVSTQRARSSLVLVEFVRLVRQSRTAHATLSKASFDTGIMRLINCLQSSLVPQNFFVIDYYARSSKIASMSTSGPENTTASSHCTQEMHLDLHASRCLTRQNITENCAYLELRMRYLHSDDVIITTVVVDVLPGK
jgi:hypothetical protein